MSESEYQGKLNRDSILSEVSEVKSEEAGWGGVCGPVCGLRSVWCVSEFFFAPSLLVWDGGFD